MCQHGAVYRTSSLRTLFAKPRQRRCGVVAEGGVSATEVLTDPTLSPASRLLQLIRATCEIFGVRKSVGAGLLAKAVGQVRRCHGAIFFAGKRAPTVDPGNLGKLRRAQICRSRLAGERGGSVTTVLTGPTLSPASRLQLIQATSEIFGVRIAESDTCPAPWDRVGNGAGAAHLLELKSPAQTLKERTLCRCPRRYR